MPNVFFRPKPSRVTPAELRARLEAALAEALPGAGLAVDEGTGDEVVLRWEDGPAAGTVAGVVQAVVNWEVRAAGAPPSKPGAPSVVLVRSFSPRALAVAVVRYQASNVRPYDSSNERAVAGLADLLEVDEPARSGYPVPDAMADLLLAAPEPAELEEGLPDGTSPADRLATKLTAVGYDRLWSRAWGGVR